MAKFNSMLLVIVTSFFSIMVQPAFCQNKEPYVRIAKIVVDSNQIERYITLLKEGMETAIKAEPGVLSMYAVYDKEHPTHITILETYASREAYQSHIQTPHFKKYKSGTLSMVKSLELTDVTPIAYESKK